jgi:hypothetical protein
MEGLSGLSARHFSPSSLFTLTLQAYTSEIAKGQKSMELLEWFRSLPPDFAFLLALPFMVAVTALVGDWVRQLLGRRNKS